MSGLSGLSGLFLLDVDSCVVLSLTYTGKPILCRTPGQVGQDQACTRMAEPTSVGHEERALEGRGKAKGSLDARRSRVRQVLRLATTSSTGGGRGRSRPCEAPLCLSRQLSFRRIRNRRGGPTRAALSVRWTPPHLRAERTVRLVNQKNFRRVGPSVGTRHAVAAFIRSRVQEARQAPIARKSASSCPVRLPRRSSASACPATLAGVRPRPAACAASQHLVFPARLLSSARFAATLASQPTCTTSTALPPVLGVPRLTIGLAHQLVPLARRLGSEVEAAYTGGRGGWLAGCSRPRAEASG